MNANRHAAAGRQAVLSSARKAAIIVGSLYLITHITSIIAGLLYVPILNDPAYILGTSPDTPLRIAAFLEVLLALANVGTGAMLFPYLKRQNEGVALSYLLLRAFEAAIIAVGILPLLALATLRQGAAGVAGADAAALLPIGQSLVSFHNWTAMFGPNFIYGVHTVLLAYLLYKSRLVPRFIPVLCLIGGPAVFILGTGKMFGLVSDLSPWMAIGAISALAWELSLALWLIFKGFNRAALTSLPASGPAVEATSERLSAA